jgi:hypothetical protein
MDTTFDAITGDTKMTVVSTKLSGKEERIYVVCVCK